MWHENCDAQRGCLSLFFSVLRVRVPRLPPLVTLVRASAGLSATRLVCRVLPARLRWALRSLSWRCGTSACTPLLCAADPCSIEKADFGAACFRRLVKGVVPMTMRCSSRAPHSRLLARSLARRGSSPLPFFILRVPLPASCRALASPGGLMSIRRRGSQAASFPKWVYPFA